MQELSQKLKTACSRKWGKTSYAIILSQSPRSQVENRCLWLWEKQAYWESVTGAKKENVFQALVHGDSQRPGSASNSTAFNLCVIWYTFVIGYERRGEESTDLFQRNLLPIMAPSLHLYREMVTQGFRIIAKSLPLPSFSLNVPSSPSFPFFPSYFSVFPASEENTGPPITGWATLRVFLNQASSLWALFSMGGEKWILRWAEPSLSLVQLTPVVWSMSKWWASWSSSSKEL